jgi:hypothetical protein
LPVVSRDLAPDQFKGGTLTLAVPHAEEGRAKVVEEVSRTGEWEEPAWVEVSPLVYYGW